MTVIIKPIGKGELIAESHYIEFEDVESIDDSCSPLIKIRHKNHQSYIMMKVPDNCYLLVTKDDNDNDVRLYRRKE